MSIKSVRHKSDVHCCIFPLTKQKQLPFVYSDDITKECFSLSHCDISGPYFLSYSKVYRFFATIVDDHTIFN